MLTFTMTAKKKAPKRRSATVVRARRKSVRRGSTQASPDVARRVAEAAAAERRGSGLAPGMQAVNSYLAVANVGATSQFLERTFGFVRGVTLPDPDGTLRYAEMRHGESVIMLVRKGDQTTATGGAAALYTYVPDVDRLVASARDAGASVADAHDTPWGDRTAVVTDPDGYRWVLATFKKLAPFA
jgi:uncharacterized glyoxalase superfamily protein PhnB